MKPQRTIAVVLVVMAVLMTAIGGLLDGWRGGRLTLTARHAWHDGMFLVVLAIFLLLL